MRPGSPLALAAVVGAMLPAATARAQSPAAEALFRDGRRLIQRGKLSAGCDKLAASQRVEPSVGTLLNLGDCREKLGQLASAWAAFRNAEALASRTPGEARREAEARRRAHALEARLTTLVIVVPHPVDGLIVRRDGEPVDPGAWNTPIPLDPDTYTITAEAPGYQSWRTEVPITPRLRRRAITVPLLDHERVATATTTGAASHAAAARPAANRARRRTGDDRPTARGTRVALRAEPPRETPPRAAPAARQPQLAPAVPAPAPAPVIAVGRDAPAPGRWTAPRKLAVGLAVASAGTLGAGVYFGLRARQLEDRADARCPTTRCDDPIGLADSADAHLAARRANLLYGVTGGALAVAAILWIAGAPGDRDAVVAPALGDDHAGVSVVGRF